MATLFLLNQDSVEHRVAAALIGEAEARTSVSSPLRQDLRLILTDGAVSSVAVGLGETYLPAFVLAIGLGEVTAGLVATLPLLAGACLQLVSAFGVRRLGSYRRWVVLCTVTQALSFIPLALGASRGHMDAATIFAIAALYWGAGMAALSGWNTWVGSLVPKRIRALFFARRTRVTQFTALLGFLLGGAALQTRPGGVPTLWVFAALFSLAGTFRLVSSVVISRQSEDLPLAASPRVVAPRLLWLRLRAGRKDGRLLAYLLFMQLAAQVAAPYFTPYMLGELKLTYVRYSVLIAAAFIARIVAVPLLGRLVRRVGPGRLLLVTGVAACPLAALWLLSNSMLYLTALQLVGGMVWGGYELASFLLILDVVDQEERTSVLSTYNLSSSLMTVAGSLIGGSVLKAFGGHQAGFTGLFVLCSLIRFATLLPLWRLRTLFTRQSLSYPGTEETAARRAG